MEKLGIYKKINQVMVKVESIKKGTKVSMGKSGFYNAVSHDDVTALLHPEIAKVGIAMIPTMDSCEFEQKDGVNSYGNQITTHSSKVWVTVKAVDIEDGSSESVRCAAIGLDNGDKATGKAYSMAVKFCYLKLFMLESCDEEELRQREEEKIVIERAANIDRKKQEAQIKTVWELAEKLFKNQSEPKGVFFASLMKNTIKIKQVNDLIKLDNDQLQELIDRLSDGV